MNFEPIAQKCLRMVDDMPRDNALMYIAAELETAFIQGEQNIIRREAKKLEEKNEK